MGSEKQTQQTDTKNVTTVQQTAEEKEMNKLLLESYRQTQPQQTALQLQGMDLTGQLLQGGELPGFLGGIQGGIGELGQMGDLPNITAPTQMDASRMIDPSYGIIGDESVNRVVQNALADIRPGMQRSGLMDSGVRAELEMETAADIRTAVAERNLERELGIRTDNLNRQLGIEEGNLQRGLAVDEFNLERQRAGQEFDIGTEYSRRAFNEGQLLNLLNLGVGGQAQVQSPILAQSGMLAGNLAGLRGTTQQGSTNTQLTMMNPFLKSFQTSLGSSLGSGSFGSSQGGSSSGGGGMSPEMIEAYVSGCWVAKEIFGSWEHPKTQKARYFINVLGPKWFKNFYWKYGEKFAEYISDKTIIKIMLRPLFEVFAIIGETSVIKEI